jgi:hypothetical protein
MSNHGSPRALVLSPLALVLALLVLAPAPSAFAGPNKDVKLVLHAVPTAKLAGTTCFTGLPEGPKDVVTEGKLAPQDYLVYVLITDFDVNAGIAGVQFGITYDDSTGSGIDIHQWQTCTLYEWPMDAWPDDGTGNLLTWNQADDCQDKAPIPVGFFFLTAHSPDRLKLIPRPVDGLARVAVCGISQQARPGETVNNVKAENLGWIDFGEGPGYNPWDPDQNLQNIQKRFKTIKD